MNVPVGSATNIIWTRTRISRLWEGSSREKSNSYLRDRLDEVGEDLERQWTATISLLVGSGGVPCLEDRNGRERRRPRFFLVLWSAESAVMESEGSQLTLLRRKSEGRGTYR